MRVLIDEDTAIQLLVPLRHLLRGHTVDHVTQTRLQGKKDVPVFRDAARAGYEVFVTNDHGQLDDPYECAAIKRSGMHHVRYGQRHTGMRGLALALGSVIAAMPMVMLELEQAGGQRLVHITGLNPDRRFELTDPARTPPRYWPR